MAGTSVEMTKGSSAGVTRLALLDATFSDLVNARDALEASVRELECLADRVFGPVPSNPAGAPKSSEPSCAAVALGQAFEELTAVKARLEAVTARLRQLA